MAAHRRLEESRKVLERLTVEISKMRVALEGLFERESSCPMCGERIVRDDPMATVRCACGWVWA